MASIELVITFAMNEEIPAEWFGGLGISIYTLDTVKRANLNEIKHSTIAIVTGVGPEKSHETAIWIRDNIKPLYVLNIGTAGTFSTEFNVGDWITPSAVQDENNNVLNIDPRLPFPWPDSEIRKIGGTLLTVSKTILGNKPANCTGICFVDMECFSQAKVFSDAQIAFHVVKGISDNCGHNAIAQFNVNIVAFRNKLKNVLNFLAGPGEPNISVIIPVYRRNQWIGPCVSSVLTQELPAKEIIIVDDGTRDPKLTKLLNSYGNHVRTIISETNRGVSWARNRGTQESHGSWLCFLDSDDLWEKDKLKNQWEYLKNHPYYEILQSEEAWIRNGTWVNPCKHHKKPVGWKMWPLCLERCLITPSAVMMKRSLFDQYHGFDENLPACEDYDLWLKITRDKPVGLEPSRSVIKHGGHTDQLSRQFPALDRFRIQSLFKAWRTENDPKFKSDIHSMLKIKLTILHEGSVKRNNTEQSVEYANLLKEIGADNTGLAI